MTRLHLPDTKSQLSFDDTETLGSSERLSEDYVSSPLLAEVTNCCANMTWLSWMTIWIILHLQGSVSSFSCAGYHVLSDLGMCFAQVGLANWRPIVKDAMYDVMQRLHSLWHACIILHLPDTKSQLSFDDTETLGSSERLSEDYVSSPLLAEVTNCCANMTWLSWMTIWIILHLQGSVSSFSRAGYHVLSDLGMCFAQVGLANWRPIVKDAMYDVMQRLHSLWHACIILHLPDTKSQLSFDDTETLGSSERLSEDYVSSPLLAEVTNCCANMTWLSWMTIWIILHLQGSVSSFSCAGYHVLSDLGMCFAQVGLANWRPIVKDAMYDVMQRLHSLWHACIILHLPDTKSQLSFDDTETLGSSERLSEDYVSSPLLAEVTNCCANMTWLSWMTIWIILHLQGSVSSFSRAGYHVLSDLGMCFAQVGLANWRPIVKDAMYDVMQRLHSLWHACIILHLPDTKSQLSFDDTETLGSSERLSEDYVSSPLLAEVTNCCANMTWLSSTTIWIILYCISPWFWDLVL